MFISVIYKNVKVAFVITKVWNNLRFPWILCLKSVDANCYITFDWIIMCSHFWFFKRGIFLYATRSNQCSKTQIMYCGFGFIHTERLKKEFKETETSWNITNEMTQIFHLSQHEIENVCNNYCTSLQTDMIFWYNNDDNNEWQTFYCFMICSLYYA